MNAINTNAQKYISMLLFLIFVLLISYGSCHQAKEDNAAIVNDSDYMDADDIEWGNFPIAETTTKRHPVIFYKEDIVSEDYDPNKDNKSVSSSKEAKPQFRRKYKDINRRNRLNRTENYRYIKPEKIYFDVYPIEYDKVNEDDSKFNDDDIQVELISLLDDANNNGQEDSAYSKHQLNKRPKKVVRHHRQRRDLAYQVNQVNRQDKREAHFIYKLFHPIWSATKLRVKYTNRSPVVNLPQPGIIVRATTKRPEIPTSNPDISNRFDGNENWEIWQTIPVKKPAIEPPRRRDPPPIIHPGDEDYGSNNQQSETTTTRRPRPRTSTYRPRTTYRPTTPQTTTTEAPVPPPAMGNSWKQLETKLQTAPVGITPCVWAVSSCCSENEQIRYACFEYLGCIGDFWDVNPCSEKFVNNALETIANYYRSK